jgi:HEAT repeat protein
VTQRQTTIDVANSILPSSQPTRRWFLRARTAFRRKELLTCRDLLASYSSLPRTERFVALCVFMQRRYRRSLPILFHETSLSSPLLAGAAAGAIARIGGNNVLYRIVKLLEQGVPRLEKTVLVWALAMLNNVQDKRTWVKSLVRLLDDNNINEECRMSVAEGLGNGLASLDRRSGYYQSSVQVLIRMLRDESPGVRVCSAYSLGQLRETSALSELRRLAYTDHSRSSIHSADRNGLSVSRAALDAIGCLLGHH